MRCRLEVFFGGFWLSGVFRFFLVTEQFLCSWHSETSRHSKVNAPANVSSMYFFSSVKNYLYEFDLAVLGG